MCNLKPVYINPTPIANRDIEIQHIGSQVFFVNDKTCFSSQITPAHGGEDGPLAPQVLASDGVADEQVAVEDDPHREKSVPRYQAPLGETEDILAKCWKQFYCVKTLHCAIPLQNWKLAISKVLTNKGLVFAQLLSKSDNFSYDW